MIQDDWLRILGMVGLFTTAYLYIYFSRTVLLKLGIECYHQFSVAIVNVGMLGVYLSQVSLDSFVGTLDPIASMEISLLADTHTVSKHRR